MRVLICGSRTWTDRERIRSLIRELPHHAVVIHGACPTGADYIAHWEALKAGLRVESYPVIDPLDGPWPQAGPRRNSRMITISRPELCFAFRMPGESPGTDDCVKKCKKYGANTHIIHESEDPERYEVWTQTTIEEVLGD